MPDAPRAPLIRFDGAARDARRSWWRDGHAGHWPGCPCASCAARVAIREPDTAGAD